MTFFSRLGRWLHESRPRSGRSDKRGRSDRPEAALPPPSPAALSKRTPHFQTFSLGFHWSPIFHPCLWYPDTFTLEPYLSHYLFPCFPSAIKSIYTTQLSPNGFFLKPVNILSTKKNFFCPTACAFPTLSLSLLRLSFTTSTYLLCFIGPQSVFAFELYEHVTVKYFHPSHHPRLSCGHDAVIFGGRTWLQEAAVFSHKDRAIFREYGNGRWVGGWWMKDASKSKFQGVGLPKLAIIPN